MAETVRVVNRSRQTLLLDQAVVADRFGSRLRGLLGRASLEPGRGLLLKPCRAVHTVGMRFAIDVGFVDRNNSLCCLIERMRPFRCSPTVRQAVYVIEAAAGTFGRTGTVTGDLIALE
ncbi:MAG: DUF192 domain-containing protein [Bacillota bacterium]